MTTTPFDFDEDIGGTFAMDVPMSDRLDELED